jgi:carboxyvinyl-carboxyphosphonate phosphorylmutase
LTPNARRKAFMALLSGGGCVRPASVVDPLSMRAAEDIGYEVAMLAGSVASLAVLGAPDLAVLTLSELAEQVRRVCRNSAIPLLVDGDHGYGNALSARRTVEELEGAGAAAVTIEDTELPAASSGPGRLLPIQVAGAKVRAAVDARQDLDFTVVGRTNAALTVDRDDLLARQAAFEDAGCQAIFIAGLKTLEDLDALAKGRRTPLILASAIKGVDDAELAARGVRIQLQGHQPSFDAWMATYRRLYQQRHGDFPAETDPRVLTKQLSGHGHYVRWTEDYLDGSAPPTDTGSQT